MKGRKSKKIIKPPVKKVKVKTVKPVKVKPVNTNVVKSRIMVCIVSGLERRVSKAGMAKGIKKFGGIIPFTDHYISNEAKRLLRQRVSPEEVQKQLRPSDKKPFSIDHKVLARLKLLKKPRHKKMTIEEVQQVSIKWVPKEPRTYTNTTEYIIDNTKNGSCIAPQLYLDSDRVCDHCKYTKHCLSTVKTFSKKYRG
jgi:hypothetical protein